MGNGVERAQAGYVEQPTLEEKRPSQAIRQAESVLSPIVTDVILRILGVRETENVTQNENVGSSRSVRHIERPSNLEINLPPDIPAELESFKELVGTALCKEGDPASYRQILPPNVFGAAIENFRKLEEAEQSKVIEILRGYSGNDPKTENDLLAISTMFGILSYGESFAKAFLNETSGIDSLGSCTTYFDVQQNFEQNYLNTCVAASMFSALSTAFVGNVQLLSSAINMEIEKIREKLQERAGDEKLSNPAFSSHSWRDAPTIKEEVERRIGQCQSTISNVKKQIDEVINSDSGEDVKKATLENCQKELLRAFERMCAIREVFSMSGTIKAPRLLSMRPIHDFVGSCALTLMGNLLAKAGSLGFYVSSLSLSERLSGIARIATPLTRESMEGTSNSVWEKTFENGIMLESRRTLNGHSVARKAALDQDGNRVFVIYDPIAKQPEIIPVSG
ncbi:MAG: hypothetical protein LBJ94_02120 [Puniceicoccales bacterium]|jgi:hypothetical protein|nr:hypothetical protein [Puniceicoccales bacterium]